MNIEPIPDNCLPFGGDKKKLTDFLRGPRIDSQGRIIGGVWDGMTPEEVLRERAKYNRLCGE